MHAILHFCTFALFRKKCSKKNNNNKNNNNKNNNNNNRVLYIYMKNKSKKKHKSYIKNKVIGGGNKSTTIKLQTFYNGTANNNKKVGPFVRNSFNPLRQRYETIPNELRNRMAQFIARNQNNLNSLSTGMGLVNRRTSEAIHDTIAMQKEIKQNLQNLVNTYINEYREKVIDRYWVENDEGMVGELILKPEDANELPGYDNKRVMMKVIEQYPNALKYTSNELKKDRELVEKAISFGSTYTFIFASPRLRRR